MNGKKLPDGGILFDETDDEDDDASLAVTEAAEAPRDVAGMDWNAGWKNESGLKGMDLIGEFVKHLPNSPGVYRMFNEAGDVLYVGKARSLKKRVGNYAQGRVHSNRIAQMVRFTTHMEFVTTRTETEALLLEANLIKRLRPRFNVLLRDDKSFPYILITADNRAPAIFKHRGARARKGDYFGPFASAGAVGRTINSLQRAFLIRTCTDSVFETRTRPCLLYQIKRCSGPCTHEISDQGYAELVKEAKDFLSGKSQSVKTAIARQMNEAAEDLDFERAAVYRDRLAALSHVQSHQGINPAVSRRRMSSPSIMKAAYPVFRCSFSAPARTGATAPISRRRTHRYPARKSSMRSLRSFTTTNRYRNRSCFPKPWRNRNFWRLPLVKKRDTR